MAITSELLGKLGGADVEVIPVEGTNSGSGSGASVLMDTITVPADETWLVAVIGTATTPASGVSGYPFITIGDTRAAFKGVGGVSALVTGTAEIRLIRNWSLSSDTFTGHVYTIKM